MDPHVSFNIQLYVAVLRFIGRPSRTLLITSHLLRQDKKERGSLSLATTAAADADTAADTATPATPAPSVAYFIDGTLSVLKDVVRFQWTIVSHSSPIKWVFIPKTALCISINYQRILEGSFSKASACRENFKEPGKYNCSCMKATNRWVIGIQFRVSAAAY